MNFIINKNLYVLLDVVREHRNKWRGHGGNPTEEELSNQLRILEDQFAGSLKLLLIIALHLKYLH